MTVLVVISSSSRLVGSASLAGWLARPTFAKEEIVSKIDTLVVALIYVVVVTE